MQEEPTSSAPGNANIIRFGGVSMLLALLLHIVLNGAVKEFPPEDPTLEELRAYLTAEAGTWAVVHGLKYLALVGLVFFAAGLFARIYGLSKKPISGWGIVGLFGAAMHVTNAVIANGIEIFAFFDFSLLSEDPTLFWLLFYLVRVLFTVEIVAWGLEILGFSMAGLESATLPKWIVGLGFLSAAACLSSSIFVVSVLTGGWAGILMQIAALSGLAWFACVGVYMTLRGAG